MSRKNPITRMGLAEVSALVRSYEKRVPMATPAEIIRHINDKRVYGKFDCRVLVKKIYDRMVKKQHMARKPKDLLRRLRDWRVKRVHEVVHDAFPGFCPSGGLGFSTRFTRYSATFTSHKSKGGYYNRRTVAVKMHLTVHPHWWRHLGPLCAKTQRLILEINRKDKRWWGLVVSKTRGYTFKAAWVMLSPRFVKENAIDKLEPYPPACNVVGFDDGPDTRAVVLGRSIGPVDGEGPGAAERSLQAVCPGV